MWGIQDPILLAPLWRVITSRKGAIYRKYVNDLLFSSIPISINEPTILRIKTVFSISRIKASEQNLYSLSPLCAPMYIFFFKFALVLNHFVMSFNCLGLWLPSIWSHLHWSMRDVMSSLTPLTSSLPTLHVGAWNVFTQSLLNTLCWRSSWLWKNTFFDLWKISIYHELLFPHKKPNIIALQRFFPIVSQ